MRCFTGLRWEGACSDIRAILLEIPMMRVGGKNDFLDSEGVERFLG
jgi:hypothetical protein